MLPKLPSIETPILISENSELLSVLFFAAVVATFGLLVYSVIKLIDSFSTKSDEK